MDPGVVLKKIEAFANNAHGSQTRKYTADPYIVHPVRVMEKCQTVTSDLAVLAAAILHDVLEDTPTSKKEIEQFLLTVLSPEEAYRAVKYVEELTDIFTRENFPKLNRRVRKQREAERLALVSPDAQTVKYADILDNTDVTFNDPDFARTYLREARHLLVVMTRGNDLLRQQAFNRVEECIQ